MTDTATTDTAAGPAEAPEGAPEARRRPGRPLGARSRKVSAPASDTAPRRTETAARGPGRPSTIAKLEEHLGTQFMALAGIAMLFDPRVGLIMAEDAPAHAKALAQLADQNPKVRKFLEGGLTGSAWVGVAIAFGTTGVKIAGALQTPKDAPAPAGEASLFRLFGGGDAIPADPPSTGTDGR